MLRLLLAGVNQEQSQKWPKLLSAGKVFLHGVLSALEVRQPASGVPHRELPGSPDGFGRAGETGECTCLTGVFTSPGNLCSLLFKAVNNQIGFID